MKKFRTHHIANGEFENGQEYTSAKMGFFQSIVKMFQIMKCNHSFRVWISLS